MNRMVRDGTAKAVSREKVFKAQKGTGKYSFFLVS